MGKKFPLGEQKFQPKGIFSNTLRRGSNKGALCNVLELVDNFGFLISFFFDKFIC